MADEREYAYDVFILYSQDDRSWARGYLIDALRTANLRTITIDDFALGAPRLLQFEYAIANSRWVVLVISHAYVADFDNKFVEIMAQHYGVEAGIWPVIPLIREDVKLPPSLGMLIGVRATTLDEQEEAVARLCQAFQKPPPLALPPPACPYPGMRAYRLDEDKPFYGRSAEIDALVQKLRWYSFVAVIGASGAGKSSLVFAGLVPALRNAITYFGQGEWTVQEVRPGEHPLDELRKAFSLDRIDDLASLPPEQLSTSPHQLLIVDQFEEIFAQGKNEGQSFIECLLSLIERRACHIVITVRADFYDDLLKCKLWPEIEAHHLTVTPLTEKGIYEAISKPAEDVNVYIEKALVERLVAGVADQPGVLPFAQEMMVRLWGKLERRWLPLRAYEDLFLIRRDASDSPHVGIQAAIAEIADGVIDTLPPTRRLIAQRILVRMVHYGEGRPNTRRRQVISDLQTKADRQIDFDETLEHLVRSRLIIAGGAVTQRWMDLAHEALLAGWPRLQKWVSDREADEAIRREIERAATLWGKNKSDTSYLFRGGQLKHAQEWMRIHSGDTSQLLGEFLNVSKKRERLAFILQATAAILVIGVVGMIALFAARWIQVQMWRNDAIGPVVTIPGGDAIVGSSDPNSVTYHPGKLFVPGFVLDQYEVTYRQYRLCVRADVCTEPDEAESKIEFAMADEKRPVTGVDAIQAATFCRWIGARLPSAIEWERAVRGPKDRPRPWPWGDQPPMPARVNVHIDAYFDYQPKQTVAVDDPTFSSGATIEPEPGITHLLGNVAEWTRTPLACENNVYTCAEAEWDGSSPAVMGLLIRGLGYTDRLIEDDPEFSIAFTPSDGLLSHTKIDVGFRCARDSSQGEEK